METQITDRIEKHTVFNAPIERVWRAISTAEEFGAWFGVRFRGPFVLGAPAVGEFTSPGEAGRQFSIRVVELDPPRTLVFRWRPHTSARPVEDDSETTRVEFTLEERDGATMLRVVETGFEAIPAHERLSNWRANDAGWDEQIGNLLAYLGRVDDRIEKHAIFNAPIERVWQAVTVASEFGQWFGVDFGGADFAPGGIIEGKITKPEEYAGMAFTVSVAEMRKPRLFSFRWHPYAVDEEHDYANEPSTLVEFAFEPHGEGTRLTITESGFNAIPEDRRAAAFRSNEEGWAIQADRVRRYVDGE